MGEPMALSISSSGRMRLDMILSMVYGEADYRGEVSGAAMWSWYR